MPDSTRVANCREKTASGRSLTPFQRSKNDSSLSPSRFWVTSRTIRPFCRSDSVTCDFSEASISPRAGTPATSTALNAKVDIAGLLGGGHRGMAADRGAHQAFELFGHHRALLG